MICPDCQKNIPDNSSFCTYCGAALSMGAESVNPYAVGVQTGSSYSANYDSDAPDIPGFVGAIKTCFRKYCVFRGRASRSEYWFWTLFLVLINICFQIAYFAFGDVTDMTTSAPSPQQAFLSVISSLWALITFLPGLGVLVRRFHDSDRSGWLALLIFIPIVGWLCNLIFLLMPSTPGPNKYGAQPVKRV